MKDAILYKYTGLLVCSGKRAGPARTFGKLFAVAAALFASVHIAGATSVEVDVELTGMVDPVSGWNVFEYTSNSDGSSPSATPALDSNGNPTDINVYTDGAYVAYNNFCADTAGGSITFEIDLPCGTFDITPGFGIGSSTATLSSDSFSTMTSSDSFTGIQGPATVYLSFLNNGYAITSAESFSIIADIPTVPEVEATIDSIDCFDGGGMSISGSPDATWQVQSSEDGTNWTTIGSTTLSGGTANFQGSGIFDPNLFYRLYDDGATNTQSGDVSPGYMWVGVTNVNSFNITADFYVNNVYSGSIDVPANWSNGFLYAAQWGVHYMIDAHDEDPYDEPDDDNFYFDNAVSWIGFMSNVDINTGTRDYNPDILEYGALLPTSD